MSNREFNRIKSVRDFYTSFSPTEKSACEYIAKIRWGDNNPVCPYCNKDNVYIGKDIKRAYKCRDCNVRFSIKTGTILQGSNIPVQQWLYVMYIMNTNTKGISSIRLSKELGVTQKTAWYMTQKIRECFDENNTLSNIVEMDETFIGGKEKNKHEDKKLKQGRGTVGKVAVMGAISREEKKAIAYPVPTVNHDTVGVFIAKNIKQDSVYFLMNAPPTIDIRNYE